MKAITSEQRAIVNRLKCGASTDELKSDYPHKTILLFKHLIYDLSDITHPGGDIIFAEHNFKEISRYVLGTHPSESLKFPAFIHSQAAYSLLDQHLIGSMIEPIRTTPGKPEHSALNGPSQLESMNLDLSSSLGNLTRTEEELADDLVQNVYDDGIHTDDNWTLYESRTGMRTVSVHYWKVSNNLRMSKNLHVVQFQNTIFSNKISLKGAAWLGKHYYIEGTNKELGGYKKKPYTTVNCLGELTSQYRNNLIENYGILEKNEFKESKTEMNHLELPDYADSLSFGVKPYNGPNALSMNICSTKKG